MLNCFSENNYGAQNPINVGAKKKKREAIMGRRGTSKFSDTISFNGTITAPVLQRK